MDIDFDNLHIFKSCYIPENIDIENYDSLELFIHKSLVRTGEGYLNFVLNHNKKETIYLRVFIYALIDYYEITKKKEINWTKFINYISQTKINSRYFPFIYLYHQLTRENVTEHESMDIILETKEQLQEANIHQFSHDYMFDGIAYGQSIFNSRRNRFIMEYNIKMLLNLSFFLVDVFEKNKTTDRKIEKSDKLKSSDATYYVKLNRNFFRLKEKILIDKWLI